MGTPATAKPIRPTDSYTRWIAGVGGTLIVAAAVTFGARDRASLDERDARQERQYEALAAAVQGHEAQLAVMKVRQERVLADLVEIKSQINANGDKLDRVIFELKKRY